jgi:flagellar basal body-associated protein FliL
LTKYNANTRAQRSKIRNVIVVIIIAVVAIASGIVAAANAGFFQASKAQSPPTTTTTASDENKPMVMHIHPILSLYIDGKPVTIPQNIGIDVNLYKTHKLDAYGMKMPDMPSMPVMYPTHTHDTSGKIHVESNEKRDYTLGDFLEVWGMDFSGKTVKMTVDGTPVPTNTDYRSNVFKDGEQIELDVR